MSEWEDFQELVKEAIKDGRVQELARVFQVADSTVLRWASGVAKPFPVFRDQVSAYIRQVAGME